MLEIKFPSENKALAAAIGAALVAYGTGATFSAELSETTELETHPGLKEFVERGQASEAGNSSETPDKSASVASATDTSTTTETDTSANAGGSVVTGNDADKLDEKGVGFNAEYCSKAQIPFYQSGKMKGQWKKRQGVEQSAYDSWYEDSLASATPQTAEAADTPIDTGAAFGNNQAAANTAEALKFADAGQFMAWVSEQQAAELLTQGDIDSAYQMTGVQVHDLFNPELFTNAVGEVYKFLANIVVGQ